MKDLIEHLTKRAVEIEDCISSSESERDDLNNRSDELSRIIIQARCDRVRIGRAIVALSGEDEPKSDAGMVERTEYPREGRVVDRPLYPTAYQPHI